MPKTVVKLTLAELLDSLTGEGELYERLPDKKLRCYACGHRCLILPGQRGICKVRFNEAGTLRVPYGYIGALQCDPTEKKPFFHVFPGSDTLTFGMLGCDFHCSYCQNWVASQALRDPAAGTDIGPITAELLVSLAQQRGARMVASSYNEPLITAEWAVSVFRPAKAAGFRCAFVSNGNATAETLDYIRPYTDCYKVDLKSMSDRGYRSLGGVLQHVLDTIAMVVQRGFWCEVVTLLVPGFNDSETELRSAAEYLVSVSADIPWHVTAFHKDYKLTRPDNTTARQLSRAAEIGYEAGLRYVYAGNLPGGVGPYENTYCPGCKTVLVERYGYRILRNRLQEAAACPDCGTRIAGIWSDGPQGIGEIEHDTVHPFPPRLGERGRG
ncbi:MAG: AmmeMemoRadiSam system radical SAM enzyme [Dehalococcoidia bacterium]